MDGVVCELCGVVGFKHLLVQCSNCKDSTRHRYCMDTIVYDGLVEWWCVDCLPEPKKLNESLEAFSNQREQTHMQLDPSITNGSYLDRLEVTNELPSWGRQRCRSRMAKRPTSKHLLNGGTFNSSEMFNGKLLRHNDVEKEAESTNDHFIDSSCVDGTNHSASTPTSEIKEHVNVQKKMVGFEPTMNSMEELDPSKVKDRCFAPKHVEEVFPQGTNCDSFPSISDVKRYHQCVTDNSLADGSSCMAENVEQPDPLVVVKLGGSDHSALDPALESKEIISSENTIGSSEPTLNSILPSVEQANGSTQMVESVEQPHPLEAESVEQPHPLEVAKPDGSDHSALDPALESKEKISFKNAAESFEPNFSMEWLDLSKEKDGCISLLNVVVGSIPQGKKTDLFPSINDAERSHPWFIASTPTIQSEEQVDGYISTLDSWKQPPLLEVIPPSVNMQKSIQGSKSPSNYSQPVQVSDQNIGNDPVNCSRVFLDSNSMSKAIELEPSCSPTGQGGSSDEKDGSGRTKCVGNDCLVSHAASEFYNLKGSNLSVAKDCLVPNADNSDEVNISDKHLLCVTDNRDREQGESKVTSYQNISRYEVICSVLNVRSKYWKVNENSNPKSALRGNQQRTDHQDGVLKVHADKNVICEEALQIENINSEVLPLETVNPCKETKISSEKRQNQPSKPSQHPTVDPKSKNTKKFRNADPAQFKSGRSSKQLDHTYLSPSSKVKDVQYVSGAKTSCSKENHMVKKRKGLVLQHDKDEDADALHGEDLNHPFQNDGQVKKHRVHVDNDVMNQIIAVENCAEVLHPGTSTNQYANNYGQAKKQKSIKAKDAGNALLVNPNCGCTQDDTAQSASLKVFAGNHCSVSRMPVVPLRTDQQCYIPTEPIDKPYWTGIIKINQEYISLAAHLSNKSVKKVQELSRSLPPVMKLTKHPKLKAWPISWKEPKPTAESIALYFFPDNMRPNKDLDRLVQYATDHSIFLKYAVGFHDLLIFSSILLPEKFQLFQGKPYLWGVFMRRKVRSQGPAVEKQDCTSQVVKKRKDQQNKVQVDTLDQRKSVPPVNQQECASQVVKKRKDQQEMVQVNTLDQQRHVPSVNKKDCASEVAKKRKDQQEKVRVDTRDKEKPVPPMKKQDCTPQVATKRKDQQDKVQVDTLDQQKSVPSMNKEDCASQVAKKRKEQQEKVQVDTLDKEKPISLVKKQDCTSQVARKRKDQHCKAQVDTLDQENPVPPVKKQDSTSQVVKKRKDQQDKVQIGTLDQKKPAPSVKKQDTASQVVKNRKDQQDKVQVDTLDQQKPVPSVNKQDCASQVAKKRKEQQEKVQDVTFDKEKPVLPVKKRDWTSQLVKKREDQNYKVQVVIRDKGNRVAAVKKQDCTSQAAEKRIGQQVKVQVDTGSRKPCFQA